MGALTTKRTPTSRASVTTGRYTPLAYGCLSPDEPESSQGEAVLEA